MERPGWRRLRVLGLPRTGWPLLYPVDGEAQPPSYRYEM